MRGTYTSVRPPHAPRIRDHLAPLAGIRSYKRHSTTEGCAAASGSNTTVIAVQHSGFLSILRTVPSVPPHLPVAAAEAALERVAEDLVPAAQDFAVKISGSPASELGELLADKVRYRRWKNQVRIVNKATKYALNRPGNLGGPTA